MLRNDDPFVVIGKGHVPAVIQAMLRAAGLEAPAHLLLPAPVRKQEPSSGATRQKRYRERHRKGQGDAAHNARDTNGPECDGQRYGHDADNASLFAEGTGAS